MTSSRFSEEHDNRSAIQPTGSRRLPSIPAEVKNRHRDSSAPPEITGRRLLLTVSQAAQLLGIGRSLLYELLADGQVESIHVGRLRRIPTDALADYIDRQRPNRTGVAPYQGASRVAAPLSDMRGTM
jgi:excisionase family DNA binding protein